MLRGDNRVLLLTTISLELGNLEIMKIRNLFTNFNYCKGICLLKKEAGFQGQKKSFDSINAEHTFLYIEHWCLCCYHMLHWKSMIEQCQCLSWHESSMKANSGHNFGLPRREVNRLKWPEQLVLLSLAFSGKFRYLTSRCLKGQFHEKSSTWLGNIP